MYFEQFYLPSLGHASYLIGDEKTGRGFVFDVRRDVGVYLEAARGKDLNISFAMDSHGHNDYLSGIKEIEARAEVELLGFAEADLGYEHRALKDGETLEFGDVGLEVIHTPGHTPEHVSVIVYDRSVSADEPALMLSGGALLVGDLARPDLLGGEEQAREMAKVFCHTIQEKILFDLPEHLEVFPTHVAGSLCGGNIGSRLSTTLGYERKTNAILAKISSSDEFVEECIRLDNLPAVPPYWKRMRSQNMAGPPVLGRLREPAAMRPSDLEEAANSGALILDTRPHDAFGGAHIPGALNVELGSSFATWAGTVLPADAKVILVLGDPEDLWEATWQMLRIGYEPPVGWLAGGMTAWRTSGRQIGSITQVSAHELRERLGDGSLNVLDVRQPAEWASGHIEGAKFITGAELPDRIDEVPAGPLAVTCGSGFRSSVAASLLARSGRKGEIFNLTGGMGAWNAAGYPTVED